MLLSVDGGTRFPLSSVPTARAADAVSAAAIAMLVTCRRIAFPPRVRAAVPVDRSDTPPVAKPRPTPPSPGRPDVGSSRRPLRTTDGPPTGLLVPSGRGRRIRRARCEGVTTTLRNRHELGRRLFQRLIGVRQRPLPRHRP